LEVLICSVAEFLPGFEGRVRDALKVLLGEDGAKRVRIGLAKDGSGVGGESLARVPFDMNYLLIISRIDCSAS
jgi:hexokinase